MSMYATTAAARRDSTRRASDDIEYIGESPAVNDIRSKIALVAGSDVPVIITGETGTGKEVVARLIHRGGNRASRPFVAMNCGAVPRELIENELFGHEPGAFTGAASRNTGCFEQADGGTLFLDEFAEMAPETQVKFLRAIEHKTFRRLGGRDETTVECRLLAATNRNLDEAMAAGRLREDLYYRLNVVELTLPPLRERREDIPLLVDHFLALFAEKYEREEMVLCEECLGILIGYDWPGNVRELRNVIEKAVVVSPGRVIGPELLPRRVAVAENAASQTGAAPAAGEHSPPGATLQIPFGLTLEETDRLVIEQTLALCGCNKSEASRSLGIDRKTLRSKLGGAEAQAKD